MKRINEDHFQFENGRIIHESDTWVDVDFSDKEPRLFDSPVHGYEVTHHYTAAEKIEIADYQISRWQIFKDFQK